MQLGIACGARPHNQHNATLAYCMLQLGMVCGLDPYHENNHAPPALACVLQAHVA